MGSVWEQGAVVIYQLYQLVFMALTPFVLISYVFCLVLHCDHVSSFPFISLNHPVYSDLKNFDKF